MTVTRTPIGKIFLSSKKKSALCSLLNSFADRKSEHVHIVNSGTLGAWGKLALCCSKKYK